jgi:hypothetical protein
MARFFSMPTVGLLALFGLGGCASARVEMAPIRGDDALPRTAAVYVREFEEGTDWASDAGDPMPREFVAGEVAKLTNRMRQRLAELVPTQVLLNSIPTQGLLVTGQLVRVRVGPRPEIHCRILIFDLARSYHYPVTVFEMRTSSGQAGLPGGGSLEDAWDVVAQRSRDFVRNHTR